MQEAMNLRISPRVPLFASVITIIAHRSVCSSDGDYILNIWNIKRPHIKNGMLPARKKHRVSDNVNWRLSKQSLFVLGTKRNSSVDYVGKCPVTER
jgi:hypothetical protein